jgi:ribosomal protein S18 acetylase RimI-like enzyme
MPLEITPHFSIEKLNGLSDRPRLDAYLRISDCWMVPPLSERVALSLFAEKILSNGVAALAVSSDSSDLGVAAFYCNDRIGGRAFLTHLAVGPEHRRHGIGKALLDYAKRYSSSQGMTSMGLEVYDANERAKRFYCSCGFTESDTSPQGLRSVASIYMVCPLR